MTKELERDLGLLAVLAISIGAMIGSGIFILPGIALEMAGPAVVIAYLLAGVLVVPAALSKSEMATAMPEAGGTYLYIERGMGPLLGTIAGIGTWFSLSFKGALALVGGVPYLLVYLPDLPKVPVALGLAVLLVVVNLVGAKQTGRLQVGIVAVMLVAMAWFVAGGTPAVDTVRFDGLFDSGTGGLLEATGFVFVSYAGVTKVASVAEEVERPDRNIPLGILGSLAFTTVLYVAVVIVMVGVAPAPRLIESNVPMVVAAVSALGEAGATVESANLTPGVVAVVLAAVLALISTANAGILSSSRYPFAMSRDALAPEFLGDVSDRFQTPVNAIAVTGVVMLVLIAFVPVERIAKLASAFQILVFALINVALIAFRESGPDSYEPSFESPLYPYVQIFGAVTGLALVTQMGLIPMAGAVAIIVVSVLWYRFYARSKIDREGIAIDAVRRSAGQSVVDRTESAMHEDEYDVLVALTEGTSIERERSLIHIAADVARKNDGRVTVVQFDEVPDQVPLEYASETQSPADLEFEERTDRLSEEFDVEITYGEIASHDSRHAIVNYARHEDVDLMLMERHPGHLRPRLLGSSMGWILRHAHCDVVLLNDRGLGDVDEVTVLTDRSPFDPGKVKIADALAVEMDATVRLVYAVGPEAASDRRATIEDYQAELAALCTAPVTTEVVESGDGVRDLIDVGNDAELLVVGMGDRPLRTILFGQLDAGVLDGVEATTLGVYTHSSDRPGLLGRLVERFVF